MGFGKAVDMGQEPLGGSEGFFIASTALVFGQAVAFDVAGTHPRSVTPYALGMDPTLLRGWVQNRDGVKAGGQALIQRDGELYALVNGAVARGTRLGPVAGQAYLAAVTPTSGQPVMGVALQAQGVTLNAILISAVPSWLGQFAGPLTQTGSGIAGAVVTRFGGSVTEGYELKVIEEEVTLTNAVKTDLTNQLPAGCQVLCSQANLQTLVEGDASGDNGLAKVGIGTAADPDIYGLSSALTKNAKADMIPAAYAVLAATTVSVYACAANGAACTEKFVAGGKVRVRILIAVPNSLDDAA